MSDAGLVVFDTSAVIAYLLREPGWGKIHASLAGGLLSSVNLCEIISTFCERGADGTQVERDVMILGLTNLPFTDDQALVAGQLRPTTRRLGLSLGDRACLALGLERGARVLTADAAWAALPSPHQIEVVR